MAQRDIHIDTTITLLQAQALTTSCSRQSRSIRHLRIGLVVASCIVIDKTLIIVGLQ